MISKIWADCCEICIRNDPSPTREIDPCTVMTRRCKGDTCDACKGCSCFALAPGCEDTFKRLRKRPRAVPRRLVPVREGVRF